MLAALLCNLEEPKGPILRPGSVSVSRDVVRAGQQIEKILYPLPAKTKSKVKKAVAKVYEYSELPTVDATNLNETLNLTQLAIDDVKSLIQDLNAPQWAEEMGVILQQLTLIAWALNDDEEALLLLM